MDYFLIGILITANIFTILILKYYFKYDKNIYYSNMLPRFNIN